MDISTRKIAFLFPGQGSQAVGMGKELTALYPVAAETFQEADEALSMKLSQLCFDGPEERLKMTEITQPAILTVSVAAWRVLQSEGMAPSYVAGHSLGEYSAHVCAGTLHFADAVRAVHHRGRYMQEAVPVGVGAMAAILALPLDKVTEACNEAAQGEVCQAANINSPDQVVISGHKGAVERAAELCKQKGAKRAVLLPVSAPFHCALMQPAQERMADELAGVTFHEMNYPLVTNVDAALIREPGDAREALIRQVTGAVQWERSMRLLIEQGATDCVEVGPGTVLCGLMRQIDRARACVNVEDEGSLQKARNQLLAPGS